MATSRDGFTVRILRDGRADPAGVGFVVGERHIVTCAHVVNAALRRDLLASGKPGPGDCVQVDFPLLGDADGAPLRSCRIEAWEPPPASGLRGGDIAGLVIVSEKLPENAGPARLGDPADHVEAAVHLFGYPKARRDGAWTLVQLRGRVGGAAIQFDADQGAAIRAQPGYSGSPAILSDREGDMVVAMLAVAGSGGQTRDAYAIPMPAIAAAWPDVLSDTTIPACPYRGLRAFGPDDAEGGLFVGREQEIGQLLELIRQQGLVVVAGPSGVGKSSLVNAGLIPALRSEGWATASFLPSRVSTETGVSPMDMLARALLEVERPGREQALDDLERWTHRLRSEGLARAGAKLALAQGRNILLHADQLEEILDPQICPGSLRGEFLEALLSMPAARGPALRLACTIRADFLRPLLEHRDAGLRLQGRLLTLSPMGADRLQRVIAEPATSRGVRYEKGLAAQIARDASSPGALPLLEFALTELWPRQRGRQIGFAEYTAIGKVAGALHAHADQVYDELSERFSEERIRRFLLALVRSRGGAADATRRIVSRKQAGENWPVAQALAEYRLVVVGHDLAKGQDTAEIAHESLIREWPRLASWVDADAEFQRWLTAMEDRAADGDLLSDTRIAEADRWLTERAVDIPQPVRALIRASKSEWQKRVTELENARRNAEDAARRAEEAGRQAGARRLAAATELSMLTRGVKPHVPVALAIESLRLAATVEGDIAARNAIRAAPVQIFCRRYDDEVNAIAYSPDGTFVVAGSKDCSCHVLSAEDGAEICTLVHNGAPRAIAVSLDGTRIATGSSDYGARVFDAVTGRELCRLDHDDEVWNVAFSPDGARIATASGDHTARIMDTGTGAEICRFEHDGGVMYVSLSPDGVHLMTIGFSECHYARMFSTATGAEIWRTNPSDWVHAVAFSPDGRHVAVGGDDGNNRVLDAMTGTEICRLEHDGGVLALAFSPDGARVAAGGMLADRTARVFDAASGAEVWRWEHGGPVEVVAFSPDGTRVATGSQDATARVLDAAAGGEICRIDHGERVLSLEFSPDGTSLVTGSKDNCARVCRAEAGSEYRRLRHRAGVFAATFSSDGARVATGSGDPSARVFDLARGTEISRLDHGGAIRSVAFSPDGELVATASDDHTARVFDAATGAEIWQRRHDDAVTSVTFSPDGELVATASDDHTARVLDAATGAEIWQRRHDDAVTSVTFSPDGELVATASEDHACVLDAATGAEIWHRGHADTVLAVAFSPDGASLAIAISDEKYDQVRRIGSSRRRTPGPSRSHPSATMCHARTGETIWSVRHGKAVLDVAFSPDGTSLATGSADDSARVLDAATGSEICRLEHDSYVERVTFSPDGAAVAAASLYGAVVIFDAKTGTELHRLDTEDSGTRVVAFSPDGTLLATDGRRDSALIWVVAHEQLTTQVESRLTRNLTEQEWRRYFRGEPFRKTNAKLP